MYLSLIKNKTTAFSLFLLMESRIEIYPRNDIIFNTDTVFPYVITVYVITVLHIRILDDASYNYQKITTFTGHFVLISTVLINTNHLNIYRIISLCFILFLFLPYFVLFV